MLKSLVTNYKNGQYKTLANVLMDIMSDITNELDNELIELERDVESGKYSNEEIAERITELRKLIYG